MRSVVFIIALLLLSPGGRAQKQPDIVIFVADDVGMDIGAYGNSFVRTPHLDRLARNGLLLNAAFLTTSSCSPSRATMLSGRYAHSIGAEDLHEPVPDSVNILPHYLSSAGYKTGIMLKAHIGESAAKQFDWNDNGFYPDWVQGRWNAKASGNFKDFLDFADTDPFFLWVGFVDAHRPYQDSLNGAPAIHDPEEVFVPPYLADTRETRRDLAHYYDEIARMDAHIGRFLEILSQRGRLENTIIMFISDNGMPFPRAKGTLYDSGIQTPWIISWPGNIKPGSTYDGLASIIDLAPTVLDLAGLPKPAEMAGKSIAPVFTNQKLPGREYVFSERNWHEADEHMRSLRTDRYKLIINSYTSLPHGSPSEISASPSWHALRNVQRTKGQNALFQSPRPAVELYDVKEDPFETHNIAGTEEGQKIVMELIRVMDQWKKESGDYPPYERRRMDMVDRINGVRITNERHGYYGDPD